MEQPFSSSKVTVEYFDPHDVYKLLAPGLIPRLPLRDLHWQSHAGPVRSINTLHVELVPAGTDTNAEAPVTAGTLKSDDGFHTSLGAGRAASTDQVDSIAGRTEKRRHQIPGLRRTPYLKVLLVRCDDNDTYKSSTRAEIREWIKKHTIPPSQSSSKTAASKQENHDAFEWLIIHVVIPNTAAATQPRVTGAVKGGTDSGSGSDLTLTKTSTSRWRGGSSTLLEKLRSDFNSSGKGSIDRVRQIRIGINDLPYDLFPRVVPAVPTGYHETEQDSENAWADLIGKFKELILSSFDTRVSQYEEDIKDKDGQRALPGWNFCTFFILKEGLARGFESVGLVEDALVGYDELSVGLDAIIHEQAVTGNAEAHGGSLLSYTAELKELAEKAMHDVTRGNMEFDDEEEVDLQAGEPSKNKQQQQMHQFYTIPISATKKPYRELILANNVSLFDFRCYIFARQISLLLRLGNAVSTREELLAKLREQQDLAPRGVAPRALPPPPKPLSDESENLSQLAEICRRTLEFVPAVSSLIRKDILAAMSMGTGKDSMKKADPVLLEVVDNIVASFSFSVAQQILAQTSTKTLPIPPSMLADPTSGLTTPDTEQKAAIPEPKTMMHPARSSSLIVRGQLPQHQKPPPSPTGFFPNIGRNGEILTPQTSAYLKSGLEELAARRAELYALSRNILEESGKRRNWTDGWDSVPVVGEAGDVGEEDEKIDTYGMEDVSLDDNEPEEKKPAKEAPESEAVSSSIPPSTAGVGNVLLRAALESRDDFYRLYETLTDKAIRHYTVAGYGHSVQANMSDLAVLKYHLGEYAEAASYFYQSIPFYGEGGWNLLELSMLVVYAKCLKQLKRVDEYVNKALRQLLCKAAAKERERVARKSQMSKRRSAESGEVAVPAAWAPIKGFLADMLEISRSLEKVVRIPLMNFFCDAEVEGQPVFDEGQDSFSVVLKMRSLLVEEFEADSISMRISTGSSSGAAMVGAVASGSREIWLQTKGKVILKPGWNKILLGSNTVMVGDYEVDQIRLNAANVLMHYERQAASGTGLQQQQLMLQEEEDELTTLKNPRVSLYQRASALDVRLIGTKEIRLDRNNTLDVEVDAGWNEITNCEVKIRSATGGLRLLMSQATVLGPIKPQPLKKGEVAGSFVFGAIPKGSRVRIRFPFTIEQEVLTVAVRVEVAYSTDKGSFTFFKTSSVSTALRLGVNVQDVFKHEALFSRFTVSTAGASPLRVYKSELASSDLFDSHSSIGLPAGDGNQQPMLVFPKQPGSLVYKITRKKESEGKPIGPKTKKTMYLKLHFTVVQDEIEALFEREISKELGESPLREYTKLVVAKVLALVRKRLSVYELEKCALLGELATKFLVDVKWETQFSGVAAPVSLKTEGRRQSTGGSLVRDLAGFVRNWVKQHPILEVAQPALSPEDLSEAEDINKNGLVHSIVIPVDIPPITIVHTADIQFQKPMDSISGVSDGDHTVCINQLLPATLHLKWTRIWDTTVTTTPNSAMSQDLEFTYEVTATPDMWLLGGRRKGHFVIPAVSPGDGGLLSSMPDTEADIPLMLIPLREGRLPYPNVEIREVRGAGSNHGSGSGSGDSGGDNHSIHGHGHCETDWRNTGETVHVITDRAKVTVSLDASGPGGGPLVLESERVGLGGGRVVA